MIYMKQISFFVDRLDYQKKGILPNGTVGFIDTSRYYVEYLKHYFQNSDIKVEAYFEPNIELAKKADIILPRFERPYNKTKWNFLDELLQLEEENPNKLFVNSPKTMKRFYQKHYLKEIISCISPSVFSKDVDEIMEFVKTQEKFVLKPIDGNKGEGVEIYTHDHFKNESELKKYIQTYLKKYPEIIAQQYNQFILQGDARHNIINGELISCYNRLNGSSGKSNMHAGGRAEFKKPTEKDYEIVNYLKPFLQKNNILLAGVDIVYDTVLEVNMHSPGGGLRADSINNNNMTAYHLAKFFESYLQKK